MKEPTHKIKRRFIEVESLPDGTTYLIPIKGMGFREYLGWLGSGLVDRNGNEIYEGDILEIDIAPSEPLPLFNHSAVTFDKGAFWIKDCPLYKFSPNQLEVVGHIVKEDNHDA